MNLPPRKLGRTPLATLVIVVVVVVAGLFARFLLAASFHGNFDQDSYEIVARLMQRGANVYAETNRYNYSPVWAHVLFALYTLARWANLSFHLCVRGFLTLADLGTACLIAAVAAKSRRCSATAAFTAYWLNPVSVLIVGYHGQFETLAFLPVLAAMLLTMRADGSARTLAVWALGTVALLIKQTTCFSVWMIVYYTAVSRRRAVLLAAASSAVFLMSFLPYLPQAANGIVKNVLVYGGMPFPYGVVRLLPHSVSRALLLLVMGLLPWLAKDKLRLELVPAMLLVALAFLAFADGVGEQFFIIPLIFGAVAPSLGFAVYSAAATVFLLASPFNVHLLRFPPPWNGVWVAVLVWLVWFLVRLSRRTSTKFANPKATS